MYESTVNCTRSARRGIRRWPLLLSLAVQLAWSSASLAQPVPSPDGESSARARTLYDEAAQLQREGRRSEACDRFVESFQLEARHPALFEVARCHIGEGTLATARRELIRAMQLARQTGDEEAVAKGRSELDALEPRISWLTVMVPDDQGTLEGFQVRVNGVALTREQWGKPVAVNPGDYQIEASARGRASWSLRVDIRGEAERVSPQVALPAPAPTAPPAHAAPPAYPPPYAYYPPPPARPAERPDVLPYEEDEPIPAGYRPEERMRTGLIVGGSILFSTLYMAAVLMATEDANLGDVGLSKDGREPLYIPFAGPFVALGTADAHDGGPAILIMEGLGQIGGATMLVLGLTVRKTVLVRDHAVASVGLQPLLGADARGLSLAGSF